MSNISANGTLTPVNTSALVHNACGLLLLLRSTGATPTTGRFTADVEIDTVQNPLFVKRHYQITPANANYNSTSEITLYFTQAEFDDFNALHPTLPLPPTFPRVPPEPKTCSEFHLNRCYPMVASSVRPPSSGSSTIRTRYANAFACRAKDCTSMLSGRPRPASSSCLTRVTGLQFLNE